jgi:hypothetical protein
VNGRGGIGIDSGRGGVQFRENEANVVCLDFGGGNGDGTNE